MRPSWIIELTLNPVASVLIRDTQRRDACEDGGQDQSYTATSQGILESPEAERGKK